MWSEPLTPPTPAALGTLGGSRAGFLTGPVPAAELAPVIEEGCPAASPLLRECLHSCRGTTVSGAGQQLGGEPGPPILVLDRPNLGPIHPPRPQLPRPPGIPP